MELMIRRPRPLLQKQLLLFCLCYLRKMCCQVKAIHFILVLLCAHFGLSTCEPCITDGMLKSAEHACESYGDDRGVELQEIVTADATLSFTSGNQMTRIGVENICTGSRSFCFPSTLPGFLSDAHQLKTTAFEFPKEQYGSSSVGSAEGSGGENNRSWLSNSRRFQSLNGQTVTCSLKPREGVDGLSSVQSDDPYENDLSSCGGSLQSKRSSSFRLEKNSEMVKSNSLEVSPRPNVEITPATLDWGQRHLYVPAVEFLTVSNTCNDSILHVYEPFSTNMQFYPCKFSEVLLQPGEVASICFVFLPRWLGMSSAHLILQTSSGGFLVQVKGHAVKSPYDINPILGPDISSSGRLSKNLSLSNPFGETLYVKEVSAWLSVSQGNISQYTEVTCSLENFQESDELSGATFSNWLAWESSQVGFPLMAMRPHVKWEISPHSVGTIIEMDFAFELEGTIFGTVCIQLLRSSEDKADTVMVPLEVDLFGKVDYDGVVDSVTASLTPVVSTDVNNVVAVAISLRNGAPRMMNFVEIGQVAAVEIFQMKFIQGLLLFPGSITQVATVYCPQMLVQLNDSLPQMLRINKNCKLVVLTNDSTSPIEIPCKEIINICSRHRNDFQFNHNTEDTDSGSERIGYWGSNVQLSSPIKEIKTAEADEFVLRNWKSQGTMTGLYVLDDHEILFPTVQVGTHCSKGITVKNPSDQPVVVQLILNSGEIVDECRDTDNSVEHHSSCSLVLNDELTTQTKYGFSIAEGALTEAYIHPYGKASLGPILFHPSNRCGWRSSALIRNNLSGVESLSLRGFGGSLSLVLLERSEPVQSIDFDLNLSIPLNMHPQGMMFRMEEMAYACSLPLLKELYAKNMGDLPLEVKSIEVSGKPCGADGFTVHSCQGFSLSPGESTKLIISYQTDFSAAVVYRDLELALTSGIFVVPIRAALPLHMFNLCKKSVFWMRLKRFSAAVILAALLMFMVLCCLFMQVIDSGSQDYTFKSEKSSISTVKSSGKSSRTLQQHSSSRFCISTGAESLLRSEEEGRTSELSFGRCPHGKDVDPKQGITFQNWTPALENHNQSDILPSEKETASKSLTVEDSDAVDTSQPCILTVRTRKEKGRRRRRRKGASLAGLIEVSSSQSGNSTPSSPLSPSLATIANHGRSPSSDIETRSPFAEATDQPYGKVQVSEPASKSATVAPKSPLKFLTNNCFPASHKQPSPPKPSADVPSGGYTSPSAQCPPPASFSAIAPHVRAPGTKLYDQKHGEAKEGNEYTYDIWGGHFSGLHLVGNSGDVKTMKTIAIPKNSNSFFVRGPQALMTKMQPNPATCPQQEG